MDDSRRSAQRFEVLVQLAQDGVTKTAGVRGQDIYAVTAPIVIQTALRVLAPAYPHNGALTLGQAVDLIDLLGSLHGSALNVFGEALPHQSANFPGSLEAQV